MKDRYTVAEYANLMGVSTQAIYKQRNTKLKGRYIKENGVSYVLADTTQNQPTTNQELPTNNQQQTNQTNQEFIQFLLKQIEIKDKQIEELQKHNRNMFRNIAVVAGKRLICKLFASASERFDLLLCRVWHVGLHHRKH